MANTKRGAEYGPIEPIAVATPGEVKRTRELLGLTQDELGARLNVSAFTVWRWEQGKRPITEHHTRMLRKVVADFELK